jgi:hypothetical protein
MLCEVKTPGQYQLRHTKNTNIFQLFHCQQTQSLLIALYFRQDEEKWHSNWYNCVSQPQSTVGKRVNALLCVGSNPKTACSDMIF